MKVAIVTQPLGLNVGGMLQNYALQQALRSIGHDPVTINYQPVRRFGIKEVIRMTARNVRTLMRRMAGRHDYMLYACDFRPSRANRGFIRLNIACTPECGAYRPVDGAAAYITGSDQVWRPRYNPGILYDQYLAFTGDSPVRRVAYAASFGVDTWEYDSAQTAECRRLAARFDAVSVREQSGVALCRDRLGIEAVPVLDPTLLLDRDDYDRLCADIPADRRKTVVSYMLDPDFDKSEACRRAARKTGARHRSLHPRATSPDRWIAAIRDAAFVVTDSFHGTVFSIIFGKPFAVMANDSRGNSRIESLLGALGLTDRIAATPADIDRLVGSPIGYDEVRARLEPIKAASHSFLEKSLV
ncbi:MAG: polysaccharide pyruvyl transferase family protein [Bacteroidales bacterium]|nr:polysaccharide pyruvyl transferase family protein [Bacteroidales bacterium]